MRFEPGSRDLQREIQLGSSVIVDAEREPLRLLVEELKAASRPEEFYTLQQQLLTRFDAHQKVTAELTKQLDATKAVLAELTKKRPVDRDAVKPVQQQLAQQELARQACKAVLHALRCVGDGIAWKALRYDRAGIAVLGAGKRVGRLTDSAGLGAELATAAAWWEQGKFAIHNDLTNCLRTGDLTLPFEPGNVVGIQEVKAGRSRRVAQDRAVERKLRFLADGGGAEVFGSSDARVARYPIPMRTHLPVLADALAVARREGYAHRMPSSSLVIVAVDPRVSRGDPGIDVVEEVVRAEAGWNDEQRIIRMVSIVRRMRERLQQFPYLAPWTIYPLPAIDIVELILGPMEFIVTLNATLLESAFEEAGVSAQVITRSPDSHRTFLRAEWGETTVELSALIREQVLSELLDPDALIEGVRWMTSQDNHQELNTLVVFADEAATWSSTSDGA